MEQPFVLSERWAKELISVGFKEPETVVLDYAWPFHYNTVILTWLSSETKLPLKVSLLCYDSEGPYVSEMR